MKTIISADYVNLYEFEYIPDGKRNPWDAIPIDMSYYHEGFLHVVYLGEEDEPREAIIPLDEFTGSRRRELGEAHKGRDTDREGWEATVRDFLSSAQEMGVCHPGPLQDFLTILEERTIDMWEEERREQRDEAEAMEEESWRE